MLAKLKSLFDHNRQEVKRLEPLVAQINDLEPEIKSLSSSKLKNKTDEFKDRLKSCSETDILPEALAVAREAVSRTIGERAYDVQLMAAITLFQGKIAEQRTGEGKSHSAVLAAYLAALSGQSVHIVTVNDYLARVGAGWYPQALHLLGLSTGCIIPDQSFLLDPDYLDPSQKYDNRLLHLKPVTRQEAYRADVLYGTNNEFGFDYLRDNMTQSTEQLRQRGHHFAIVDEVDFALIDEARTPLIISIPSQEPAEKYQRFAALSASLQPEDYVIDEKARSATLSEYGIRKVERALGVKNLYEEDFATIHYIENAIKATALYQRDRDYVIKDDQVIIVDEFTGRLMHGRRWSDGLHQAIEAKEKVPIQQESKTAATITFQNYFRLYKRLAGMTGTAATEAEEFRQIYRLDTVVIPTHRSIIRNDEPDLVFKNQATKYAAIVADIEKSHQRGQPVLVGTTSIQKNQTLSSYLKKKKITHEILNAKNHILEAQIIANAGRLKAVTIATNMAGRGVDIILGGAKPESKEGKDPTPKTLEAWKKEHQKVLDLGGLRVIGTERHESRRIDNQLRGRAGRQGDPGSSQFYTALDDDLMRIFGGEQISSLMSRFKMPENTPLTHSLISRAIEQIQTKVEGFHFDTRKNTVEYDDVINRQRQIVYDLRNRLIRSSEKSTKKLNEELFLRLDSQLNQIFTLNSNPSTGNVDWQKLVLELNEIVPLPNTTERDHLVQKLEKEPEALSFLQKMLRSLWQRRQEELGQNLSSHMLKLVFLSTLDDLWIDHLSALDNLRDGVRLRSYGQKDPLVEYRKEGFEMFQVLMDKLDYNLARRIFRVSIESPPPRPALNLDQAQEKRGNEQDFATPSGQPLPPSANSPSLPQFQPQSQPQAPSKTSAPNRNDPCPCGSGKKYKKCHYPEFG